MECVTRRFGEFELHGYQFIAFHHINFSKGLSFTRYWIIKKVVHKLKFKKVFLWAKINGWLTWS